MGLFIPDLSVVSVPLQVHIATSYRRFKIDSIHRGWWTPRAAAAPAWVEYRGIESRKQTLSPTTSAPITEQLGTRVSELISLKFGTSGVVPLVNEAHSCSRAASRLIDCIDHADCTGAPIWSTTVTLFAQHAHIHWLWSDQGSRRCKEVRISRTDHSCVSPCVSSYCRFQAGRTARLKEHIIHVPMLVSACF